MVNDRQSLDLTRFAPPPGARAVEWRICDSAVEYPAAVAAMEARAADIASGEASELVWLLEHPPLYTSGTSGKDADLLDPRFPLFTSGRGGQLTYHGPGQRVAYVMLDLKRRRPDVRAYVAGLEEWIIRTLAHFNVRGERREDRVGVWVKRPDKGDGYEDKIAAILSSAGVPSSPGARSGRRTQTPTRSSRRSPRMLNRSSVAMIQASRAAT